MHNLYNIRFSISLLITFNISLFIIIIIFIAFYLDKTHALSHRNKENLELALSSAKAGTWNWDFISDKITVDEQCLQLFGFEKNEPCENLNDYLSKMHLDDRGIVTTAITKVKIIVTNALFIL